MVTVRKTTNVVPFGRASSKSQTSTEKSTTPPSPFASKPVDALKAITDRKSRPLSEEQKLALLQRALHPFASEARSHLPSDLSSMEKEMRKKMLDEGFSDVVANEAGEEAVDVLLRNRRVKRKQSNQRG